jgi:hypothetical protein
MTPLAQRVAEARQLQRLRALREDQARSARARAQQALDQAQQAVERRQQEVQQHRNGRADLAHHLVGDAAALPRLGPYFGACREDLDDKLERAEYALIDDEELRDEAQQSLAQAHTAWQRSLARSDAASDLLDQAQQHHRQDREQRAEREDPAPSLPPGSSRP